MKSKVSVIVPVYNAEKTLHKCITSILEQSFAEFELILVDDGSTDNSLNVCNGYANRDPRVTIIHKKNEGSIAARRTGVVTAESGYVTFVDADDWVHRDLIATLYAESVKHDADITVCNYYKVISDRAIVKSSGDDAYFKEERLYEGTDIKDELVVSYLFGHTFPGYLWGKMYKWDLLIGSGDYLRHINFFGDDIYYNLEMLLKAERVKVVNQALYYYRAGGGTSKYMPYLFNDMVGGYRIQKVVIDRYFNDNRDENYEGISIMLLNFFKTCLRNLFEGDLSDASIQLSIKKYLASNEIFECTTNGGCIKYFPNHYLTAIQQQDIEYLFNLGKSGYNKQRLRQNAVKLMSWWG